MKKNRSLRTLIAAASAFAPVQRAHDFMNWKQDGREPAQDGHIHQKKFVVCTIKISPLGYMLLMEERALENGYGHSFHREGYFRWHGPLHKSRSVISKSTILMNFSAFKMSFWRSFETKRHPIFSLTRLLQSGMAMYLGVLNRIHFAQRVNEGFTKHTARDQPIFSAKISYVPSVGFAGQSLMF